MRVFDTVKNMNKKRDDNTWAEVKIRPFSRTVDYCSVASDIYTMLKGIGRLKKRKKEKLFELLFAS